jgi:phage tail-like protein
MAGLKFFTFRKTADWKRGIAFHLDDDRGGGLTLRRQAVYRLARRHRFDHPQLAAPIADTAVDADGRWYLLDERGVIWRADLPGGHAEAVRSEIQEMAGRARIAAGRKSITLLHAGPESVIHWLTPDRGQIRWTVSDWRGEPFHGVALAAAPDDGLVVLAATGGSGGLKLLCFDAAGETRQEVDVPPADEGHEPGPEAGRYELVMAGDGSGWLLDRKARCLAYVDLASGSVSWLPASEDGDALDIAAICPGGPDSVWALVNPADALAHGALVRITRDGAVAERGNTGNARGNRLFASLNGTARLIVWNEAGRDWYVIEPSGEIAPWPPLGRRIGFWISGALDSGSPETEWHKIVLESGLTNDTQIIVRHYASDEREVVIDGRRVAMDDWLRDESVPPEVRLEKIGRLWSGPMRDPHDALLHKARGRYLWLLVELIGSEQHAPVVQALEIRYPRETMLGDLPAIYQRHEPSRDFLSRFLSLFQTMLEATDRKIDQAARTFDPGGVPASSLGWLLGWLGIEAEDYWTEAQLRELLRRAPEISRLRGTRYALETIIGIYTGEKPIILEYDQVKPLKEIPELGPAVAQLYASDPNSFNVLVKAEYADTETKRVTLQHLIETYKPAFTTFKLIVLQPWVYMDLHSYLGMNTVLSEPDLLTLNDHSSMPHHTITIDRGFDHRLDLHTRLGIDARLE